jgi:hypothetical protein
LVINDDPKAPIIKSFSKRRTIAGILLYAVIICFAFAINSFRHSDPTLTGLPPTTELVLGLVIGIGLLIIAFFLWRCPACNKFLGFKTDLKWCPHCKEKLEPDWTKTEKPVMATFKKKKRLVYILGGTAFVFMVPMFIASNNPQSKIALICAIIAGIVDLGIFIFIFVIWRCPNCNKYLGRYVSSNCPRCGVRLRM